MPQAIGADAVRYQGVHVEGGWRAACGCYSTTFGRVKDQAPAPMQATSGWGVSLRQLLRRSPATIAFQKRDEPCKCNTSCARHLNLFLLLGLLTGRMETRKGEQNGLALRVALAYQCRRTWPHLNVGMPEVSSRVDHVADALLQLLSLRKATLR